jgi:hypothetical protein
MSTRLMDRKVRHAREVDPEIVVSGNPGCMIQLATGLERAGATQVKVKHIAELLDESYRRAGHRPREPRRPGRPRRGHSALRPLRRFNRFRRDEHDPTARPVAPDAWQ